MTSVSKLSELSELSEYNFTIMDNYKKNLVIPNEDIFSKYIRIIKDYCNLFLDEIINIEKNYNKYLFIHGLKIISHVFNILLLYTNNLDFTLYHMQKAYFYYVEFISQIDNINHSFLQLNSKDAAIFVYKKTIFEIDNDIKKLFVNENYIKLNNIYLITQIYNNVIYIFISNQYTIKEILDNLEKFENNFLDFIKFKESVKNVKLKNSKTYFQENQNTKLKFLHIFLNYFLNNSNEDNSNEDNSNEDNSNKNILEYLDSIFNKIKKSDSKKINSSIKNINNYNFSMYTNYTPNKFINILIKD